MAEMNHQQQHFDVADNDRISKLPDSILCHILSLLPTKDTVTTSCLSKRWRFTWTSVDALDLSDLSFWSIHIPKRQRTSACMKSFKNFVNMVLILRSHPVVRRFKLQLKNVYQESDVHSWLFAAITHNVQELDLSTKQGFTPPQIVFNCGTIVELKLDSNIKLNVPESISLPSLKVLHLTGILTLCDANISRLLSGSPVLERLLIHRHHFDSCNTFSIVSSSLKDFVLKSTEFGRSYGILVDAPKLELFELIDERQHKKAEIEFKNASSIARVTIDFKFHDEIFDRESISLWEIRNVKILSLPLFLLHKAQVSPGVWLLNLTKLSVRYCKHDIEMLPRILTRLPSLQVLILKKAYCWRHKATCDAWKKDKLEIACLKYSFKRLEIEEFEGGEEEMEIVEFIVENARVLNEIRLLTRPGRWTEPEKVFLRKLLKLPRCSNAFKFSSCLNALKIVII